VARLTAPESGLPSDRHSARNKRCRSRKVSATAWAKPERDEETDFQIGQQTDESKKMCCPPQTFLTQKAPYKGPGADSEEEHEPASDIDTNRSG
jgi:hypothetical protein